MNRNFTAESYLFNVVLEQLYIFSVAKVINGIVVPSHIVIREVSVRAYIQFILTVDEVFQFWTHSSQLLPTIPRKMNVTFVKILLKIIIVKIKK